MTAEAYILSELASGPVVPGELLRRRPRAVSVAEYRRALLALILRGRVLVARDWLGRPTMLRLAGDHR